MNETVLKGANTLQCFDSQFEGFSMVSFAAISAAWKVQKQIGDQKVVCLNAWTSVGIVGVENEKIILFPLASTAATVSLEKLRKLV